MFDTHSHIHSQEFDQTRLQLLKDMESLAIHAITVGTDVRSSIEAIDLATQFPWIYASVGMHPHESLKTNIDNQLMQINALASNPRVVAIGECGFDLYYHQEAEARAAQEHLFRSQIELALECHKPLIVHTRDAFEDTYRVLQEYRGLRVIYHCFTGDINWVQQLSRLNHTSYFSFSGIVTFPKNTDHIKDSARRVSLDSLLVETDAPYLAPVPVRGNKNSPLNLPYIIQEIASLRNIPTDSLANILDQNARTAFSIL